MLTFKLFLWALQVAVVAHVLTLLMQEGNLLHGWAVFLNKRQWTWPDWLLKMLGGCSRCFCGQVGFWVAAIVFRLDPFQIVTFSSVVIFSTEIFRKYG